MVLLRGEAGVGKTTLLARFADQLNPRPRVLRGWCDPLGAPRPLGPLTDALAGLDAAAGAGLAAAVDSGIPHEFIDSCWRRWATATDGCG